MSEDLLINDENEVEPIIEEPEIQDFIKSTDADNVDAVMAQLEKEAAGEPEVEKTPEDTSTEATKPTEEPVKETSTEKQESEKAPDTSAEPEKPEEKPFVLDDEMINSCPEEDRAILMKYKGKTREELNKIIVDSVLHKNEQDPIKALIAVQREIGRNNLSVEKPEVKKEEEELPPLPDNDPKVNEFVSGETVKRLKSKYPEMPTKEENETPEAYKERYNDFQRNLFDDDPDKYYDFQQDKRAQESTVKTEVRQFFHLQKNHVNINNSRLEKVTGEIKAELGKYGIKDPEKELGLSLNLEADNAGQLTNKELNALMMAGTSRDPEIIGVVGNIPVLKVSNDSKELSPLTRKFLVKHQFKLIDAKAKIEAEKIRTTAEKLKKENLNTLDSKTSGNNTKVLTVEDFRKIQNSDAIDKAVFDLEKAAGLV